MQDCSVASLLSFFSPCIQLSGTLDVDVINKHINPQSMSFSVPPTEDDVRDYPDRIWVPESEFESGVDWLVFYEKSKPKRGRASGAASEGVKTRIAVGVQNKWSDKNTTLSLPSMQRAAAHFHGKMSQRGWETKQMYFIFIMHRPLTAEMETALAKKESFVGLNVAAISTSNRHLQTWAGPTFAAMLENVHALSRNSAVVGVYDHRMSKGERQEYTKGVKANTRITLDRMGLLAEDSTVEVNDEEKKEKKKEKE
jgi:hypothetical protein